MDAMSITLARRAINFEPEEQYMHNKFETFQRDRYH